MSETGPTILIVEDEPPMRRFLRAALGSHGFHVIEASTAREGASLAASNTPDLLLLDLGLPDEDGLDLVRRLREWCERPIIVLSARGREQDKVLALDAGADDYLTKPFGVGELLARIRVAFRHAKAGAGAVKTPVITIGPLMIDVEKRLVTVSGAEVHLTPIEYKLLLLLAQNAGKVLMHRQILHDVWGPAYAGQTHYVRVHMAELRKKIEPDPARPKLLVTEPGVGYRMRDEV